MPRSITRPQTGSIVWYFSAATGVAQQAAVVTQTVDPFHFNLFVLSGAAVGSAVLNVAYNEAPVAPGQSVTAAAVSAGGANYAVNDLINLPNGVILKVLTLTTTAVATVSVISAGLTLTVPGNPVAQVSTSGAGTGATFNLTWSAAGWCTYPRVNEFTPGVTSPFMAISNFENRLLTEQHDEAAAQAKKVKAEDDNGNPGGGGNPGNGDDEEDEDDPPGGGRTRTVTRTTTRTTHRTAHR